MNKFLTLIRRDMADNRGALIITPLVIAAVLLFITIVSSLTGNARFGFDPKDFSANSKVEFNADFETDDGGKANVTRDKDGRVVITSPDGQKRSLAKVMDKEGIEGLTTVLPIGTGVASLLPLSVAAIAILFVLAGALHDERKDRTILFWKSMPVSDIQTVGAKVVSIVGIGLSFAFVVAIVLHLAITTVAVLTLDRIGLTGIPLGDVLANAAKLWLVLGFGLLLYVGWALPVYGWVSMVSAWAPKMPFVAAFAPLIVVPLMYMAVAFRGDENDPILNVLWDPVSRLTGEPIFSGLGNVLRNQNGDVPAIPVNEMLAHLSTSLSQPMLWVGLLIAGGFIYAASEIRRRRAL
jgi:ABC-2 type transport system permease protein